MTTANNLPTLILDRILDYLPGNEVYNNKFKDQLPILWICHQWREATLPAVYRNLIFYFDNNLFIHKRHYPFETNAVLFRSARLRSYVRTLSFVGIKVTDRFPDVLGQVLKQLEDDKIDLLSIDYYTHLLCDKVNEKDYSDSDSDPSYESEVESWGEVYGDKNAEMRQTLQQQEKLVKALQSCSRDFTSIRHVDIIILSRMGAVKWFPNTILNTYADSIRSLVCKTYKSLNLTQFPQNLTRLTYHVSRICSESIPVTNPLSLEHLDIIQINSDNIWNSFPKYFPPSKLMPYIEFPNLTSLTLKFGFGYRPVRDKEHVSAQLRFPSLRRLNITFWQPNGPGILKFLSHSIPPHLENVILNGNIPMLKEFLELPINSIDCLRVMLLQISSTDYELYQTTSKLFGKISNNFKYIRVGVLLVEVDYNHPQLDWSRIKHLDVGPITTHNLTMILTQIPNLEHIYICCLSPIGGAGNGGLPASLCLRSFKISFSLESESESVADTVLNIWKRSPQLREYYLYEDLNNLVIYKVNQIQDKHPHLGQLLFIDRE